MSDRKEIVFTRTVGQLVGRGLCPCNGCLSTLLRLNGSSVFGRRVYSGGVADAYPMVPGACADCGYSVWSNGEVRATSYLMWEMHRRETKANGRRPDATVDVGTQIPEGGGLLMRHGDSQTEFSTGAKRDTDEGKGTPSLISPVLIHRLGVLLQKGAEHYGADNWMKGMPYRRTADSMIRHLYQWLAGDNEEDHLAAVAFGAMALMTYESNQDLDQKMDDRDEGLKKILPSILTSVSTDAKIESEPEKDGTSERLFAVSCSKGCGSLTFQPNGVCVPCGVYGLDAAAVRALREMNNVI